MPQVTQHTSHIIPYDLYSTSQYPWWCFNIFIILWISSKIANQVMLRCASEKIRAKYMALDQNKKDNVIVYILQFVVTSVALGLQVHGGWNIFFQWKDTPTENQLRSLNLFAILIPALYIWELIYRKAMGTPLLIHHVCALTFYQLFLGSFFDTQDVMYLRWACLGSIYATFEQHSFVALFFYRLDIFPTKQAFWFYFSAAQSLLTKTAVTIGSLVYFSLAIQEDLLVWGRNRWESFWIIALLPLLISLYAAQLYACYILYILGQKCQRNKTKEPVTEAEESDSASARNMIFASTKANCRESSGTSDETGSEASCDEIPSAVRFANTSSDNNHDSLVCIEV